MAQKTAFVAKDAYPFFEMVSVETDHFGGFALSQKRKNEIGAHWNLMAGMPGVRPLEVSGSSLSALGMRLSAMSLSKRYPSGVATVEGAFQSSKIFRTPQGMVGPFPELVVLDGKECKKKVKELSQDFICRRYDFFGQEFPAPQFHVSLFYDWLYLTALTEPENAQVAAELAAGGYNAFTDLATSAPNSQARSAAIWVGLRMAGIEDAVSTVERYLELFRCAPDGQALPGAHVGMLLPDDRGRYKPRKSIFCRHDREEVEGFYAQHYANLNNSNKDRLANVQGVKCVADILAE